jgi:hypothetical protein
MIAPKTQKPSKADEHDAYELVTLRDMNSCQRCGRDCGPIARDHRQNRQSGNTIVSNLQLLGLGCHQWKTEHPRAAIAEGWAVPSWADPREWPARRWFTGDYGIKTLGWVLYRDNGDVLEITESEAVRRMEGTVR